MKNCTWHRGKWQFWNVSINQPYYAPALELSVWTPTPSPEDEVCNISEASVTNYVPAGAIPRQPMCVKCGTVGILCRNIWEKNQNLTTQKTTKFWCLYPAPANIVAMADCVLYCQILFFLGINNWPIYTTFPAKMNSGFWPTTQNLQNQQCHRMGLAKRWGRIQWQVPIRLIRVCSTM